MWIFRHVDRPVIIRLVRSLQATAFVVQLSNNAFHSLTMASNPDVQLCVTVCQWDSDAAMAVAIFSISMRESTGWIAGHYFSHALLMSLDDSVSA